MEATVQDVQQEIVDEFSAFDDWMDKYEYLIELGKSLPVIDEKNKQEDRLIKGCQSRVWLNTELRDGRLYFTADSDAIITKGIISLLIRVYNGRTPEEILAADNSFIDRIGLKENLSPTRANGMDKATLTRDVVRALRQVYDPEIPVNIYDLGLIYDITIDDDHKVFIKMTMTAPNCPMSDILLEDVHTAVADTPGVTDVAIEITFDPPWDKSRMSDEALLELGLL